MIHPNLHPLLVHFPIALLITGTAIELFGFLGGRAHPIRSAGRWMILLGTLAAVLGLTSGIYALNQALNAGIPAQQSIDSWHDLTVNSPLIHNAPAWTLMVRHLLLESIATVVLLITVATWIACSDTHRDRLKPLWYAGLLIGVGLVGTGGYFSGEGVYAHGVGVQLPTSAPSATESQLPVNPIELHLLGAGLVIALSTLSIALCCRAGNQVQTSEPIHEIAAVLSGFPMGTTTTPLAIERPPAARFALLAGCIALITAAGGWWVLASDSSTSLFAFQDLWQLIRDPAQNNQFWLTRRLAHVICGSMLVIIPLILAALTRWQPRRRMIRGALVALLVLAIASQVWLGVLLMYDGNSGPVTRLVPAEPSP